MDNLTTSIVTVITAIIGVAIIAVLVSRQANTGAVITAAGNAASNLLSTAVSPLSGTGGFGGRTAVLPPLSLNLNG